VRCWSASCSTSVSDRGGLPALEELADAMGNEIHDIQTRDALLLQENTLRGNLFRRKWPPAHLRRSLLFCGRLYVQYRTLNDTLKARVGWVSTSSVPATVGVCSVTKSVSDFAHIIQCLQRTRATLRQPKGCPALPIADASTVINSWRRWRASINAMVQTDFQFLCNHLNISSISALQRMLILSGKSQDLLYFTRSNVFWKDTHTPAPSLCTLSIICVACSRG